MPQKPTFDPTQSFTTFDPSKPFSTAAPEEDKSWWDLLEGVGKGVWESINPMPMLKAVGTPPQDTTEKALSVTLGPAAVLTKRALSTLDFSNIGEKRDAIIKRARKALETGDYKEGASLALSAYGLGSIAEKLDQNKPEEAVGQVIGLIGPLFLGGKSTPGLLEEAPIARVAKALDVPLDAATATGNRGVAVVQAAAGKTAGGQLAALMVQGDRTDALTAAGKKLADKIAPGPLTDIEAGLDVQGTLGSRAARDAAADAAMKDRVKGLVHPSRVSEEGAGAGIQQSLAQTKDLMNAVADKSYDAVRAFEADPKNQVLVQTGMKPSSILNESGNPIMQPVMEPVAFPVDLKEVKAALEPLYQSLLEESKIAPLQGSKVSSMTALARLMNGPDVASLSMVDSALGSFKKLARLSDNQVSKTAGQGIATQAVGKLEAAVGQAADAAGPEVAKALATGRTATKAKYAAIDTLESISDEPVKAFRQATLADDAGINLLRDIQKSAPGSLRPIGRAYLEGLFQEANPMAAWEKMGPETRKLLFGDQGTIQAISAAVRPSHAGSAANVLKTLADEPVKVFAELTTPGDSMLGKLQAVNRVAPQSIDRVGRAFVDDLVTKISDGDVRTAIRGWEKVGPRTKALLVKDPDTLKAFDDFMTLAGQISKADAASKVSPVVQLSQAGLLVAPGLQQLGVGAQISGAMLGALLHSPRGIKILTKGMTIPSRNMLAAGLWANQVVDYLGQENK